MAYKKGTNNSEAISGTSYADTLEGYGGDDTLTGSGGRDTLLGGDGNDSLDGGTGNDSLNGGNGHDYLNGGTGTDAMDGGDGNDYYVFNVSSDYVIESPTALGGIDTVETAVSLDLTRVDLVYIENALLSGATNNNLTGNNLDNKLTGNSGANTLMGGAGNDSLYGGAGNDQLWGGANNDTLEGGEGNDTLSGGVGNDTYRVDSTTDLISEATGIQFGIDRIEYRFQTSTSVTLANNVEQGVLFGTLSHQLTGNQLDNLLIGGMGHDTLFGSTGNDTLDGGAGNDALAGGTGNDTYYIDSEDDQITELAGEGSADMVITTLSYYSLEDANAQIEHLTFQGEEGAWGLGNASNNAITGSAGADTLEGGAGNDTLAGGAGEDFYMVSGEFGVDTVIESDTSQDIDILGLVNLTPDQLWFSHAAGTNDLLVSVIGTSNQVTLSNWYAGMQNTLEYFQVLTPTQEILTLARADVEALVQAMAALTPPTAGQTNLSAQQHQALDPVINASWVYWSPAA